MGREKVFELLEHWDERRRKGAPVRIEELCRDCPELRDELARLIDALEQTDWLEEPGPEDLDSPSPPTPAELGLPERLGRYELRRWIGEGGFGYVFEAFDPQLDRSVAVKIARPDRAMTAEQVERFLTEARRAAGLQHPGIVPIHDVGRDGPWCYIVSDLIEGTNLATVLAASRGSGEPAATIERSTQIVAEVAAALEYAHRRGLVHRDIKPANILIGGDGRVFLADFGIAVPWDQLPSGATISAGTAAYMPPEQLVAERSQISPRGDIYSLGVVLYELLAGRLPFSDSDIGAARIAMPGPDAIAADPPPPSKLHPAVPAALDAACLRAMARDPARRFRSADEFRRTLVAAIRPKSWSRRQRALVALIAALLVACAAVVGVEQRKAGRPAERPSEPAAARDTPPAPGAVRFEGHYYKFIRGEFSWRDAKLRCEQMGGRLAVIENPRQQEFIASLLGKQPSYVLIGLSDEGQPNDWRWVDGSPARFTSWGKGEPNHLGGIEHYGAVNPAAGSQWLDIANEHRAIAGFVCQWDADE